MDLEVLEQRVAMSSVPESQVHLAAWLSCMGQMSILTGKTDPSHVATAADVLFGQATEESLVRMISSDPRVQSHFEKCLAQGTSEKLAEMFALAQPPMSKSDREFLEGWGESNQFEGNEWLGERYAAEAAACGVDITGRRYLSGLAAYPGDPRAWVNSRDDVRHVCEERGWGCSGAVDVKAREPDQEPASVGIADDIVDSKVASILSDLPASDVPHVDVQDLREQVADSLKPTWSD